MRIILSEKQLKKISESELGEAVGVPSNIINSSIQIYDKLIEKLKSFKGDLEDLVKDKIKVKGEFVVGDITVKKIIFDFEIYTNKKTQERDFISATHRSQSRLLKRLVFKTVDKEKEIHIGFGIGLLENDDVSDLVNLLEEKKERIITTLSHEIQHAYTHKKGKYESIPKRSEYRAFTQFNFAMIEPLNDFLFHSYFIHKFENFVRPTEVATQMELQGISKKDFLQFLMKNETYQMLKEIQSFTYENLRKELTKYTSMIKDILDNLQVDTTNMDDEQLVNEGLRLFLVNLTNMKGETLRELLTTDFREMMFGFTGQKDTFFRKYIAQITKFRENYEAFFKSEEKRFHNTATNMIKKISKIYSLAK